MSLTFLSPGSSIARSSVCHGSGLRGPTDPPLAKSIRNLIVRNFPGVTFILELKAFTVPAVHIISGFHVTHAALVKDESVIQHEAAFDYVVFIPLPRNVARHLQIASNAFAT